MTGATYHLRRHHEGRASGTVRVQATGPREAFERVRRERPAYAHDRLILCGVEGAAR